GLVDNTVNGTGLGTPSGTPLYANLVSGGLVVGSVAVDPATGTYTLTGANGIEINTAYEVIISTTQGTNGAAVSTVLPTNWVVTGENLGSGAGNDGTANGSLSVSVGTTNVSNVNFGIEQLPNSATPATTSQVNPGGTTQVQSVTLTGSDPEDGALGTSNSVQITTLPGNATLYYNGVAVTSGQIITNYNPTLLTLDPTFAGAGTVTFNFAFVDAAGNADPSPATATMNFTDISISGTVFNDANGLVDNTVNGTGLGNPSGTPLYANLVSGGLVVGSVAVDPATGTYTLTGANGIEINTAYEVIISTTQGTNGAAVSTVLPTNWVVTGENLGSGAGNDGTANGSLSVSVGTTNVSNVNFGIEQLPVAYDDSQASQINPGGTLTVPVAATLFSATDADGTVTGILITAFPSNATSITIDGTLYTALTFPVQGVLIPANTSGEPAQSIQIDPVNGSVTVEIPYVAVDNANMTGTVSGTISLPFSAYQNSTLAVNDDNNTFVNTPVSGDVTTNDLDPEGNTQTFGGFDDPSTPGVDYTASGTLSTIPGTDENGNPVADAGDLIVNPDGSYTFIPANGFVGVIYVTYQMCDNGTPVACTTAELKIDVAPMPDPFDTSNNDVIANNDDNLSYGQPVSDNVLNNDNDPNEDTILFGGFENPAAPGTYLTSGTITVSGTDFQGNPVANAGTLTINPDGSYTFTPANGFNGVVEVPYLITDNASLPASDNAILTIIVLPQMNGNENDAPFGGDDFSVTLINTPVEGSFISNDNDPNGDDLSVNGVAIDPSGPQTAIGTYPTGNGTITLYSDGTYVYTPSNGFVGNDRFVYEICDITSVDPQPLCTEATIYLTVSDVYQEFGDLPASFGVARNLITTSIVNGVPVPSPSFWLGTQIDGEIETQGGASANGDDNNNADGSTGDEDGLGLPTTLTSGDTATFAVTVNSNTSNLTIHYGLWIDWNNDGTFEDFYTGSGVTNSPTTVNQVVNVPANYIGGGVNMRVRAFDSAPAAADYQGTFYNGETEDFVRIFNVILFPVELLSFNAELSGVDGVLNWVTNQEINSDYFTVERSLDRGVSFESIGNVNAAGHSTTETGYDFVDAGVAMNKVNKIFYRLKMVDTDGTFNYSNIAELKVASTADALLNVFPNPARDLFTFEYQFTDGNNAKVVIFNPLGQVMESRMVEKPTSNAQIQFNGSEWARGVYFIHLTTVKNTYTFKFILD
ncbi:MAG: cadherin-like domain-containing protein, partial [Bacteroidia bacterium]|nr:cadherin-like domain-containing protein [Bacteroidia bacterium]